MLKFRLGFSVCLLVCHKLPSSRGLTHSPAQGKCWGCVNRSEAGLAEPEEGLQEPCDIPAGSSPHGPWHLRLWGADTRHFAQEAEGAGKRLPYRILCWFSVAARKHLHSAELRAGSFCCPVFFFCVIAQQPEGDRYR